MYKQKLLFYSKIKVGCSTSYAYTLICTLYQVHLSNLATCTIYVLAVMSTFPWNCLYNIFVAANKILNSARRSKRFISGLHNNMTVAAMELVRYSNFCVPVHCIPMCVIFVLFVNNHELVLEMWRIHLVWFGMNIAISHVVLLSKFTHRFLTPLSI